MGRTYVYGAAILPWVECGVRAICAQEKHGTELTPRSDQGAAGSSSTNV